MIRIPGQPQDFRREERREHRNKLLRIRRDMNWVFDNFDRPFNEPPSKRAEKFRKMADEKFDLFMDLFVLVECTLAGVKADDLIAKLELELATYTFQLKKRPGGEGALRHGLNVKNVADSLRRGSSSVSC